MFRDFVKRMRETFSPVVRRDPLFGELQFNRIAPPGQSYWEGAVPFAPVDDTVDVCFDGDEAGLGSDQHDAFRAIEARYASLLPAIGRALAADLAWTKEPHVTADNVWRHFRLVTFEVPRRMADDAEWALTFAADFDDDHQWTVAMRGWTPTGDVTMDG